MISRFIGFHVMSASVICRRIIRAIASLYLTLRRGQFTFCRESLIIIVSGCVFARCFARLSGILFVSVHSFIWHFHIVSLCVSWGALFMICFIYPNLSHIFSLFALGVSFLSMSMCSFCVSWGCFPLPFSFLGSISFQGLWFRRVLILQSRVIISSFAHSCHSALLVWFLVAMWCLTCCMAFLIELGTYFLLHFWRIHLFCSVQYLILLLYMNVFSRGVPSFSGFLLSNLIVP